MTHSPECFPPNFRVQKLQDLKIVCFNGWQAELGNERQTVLTGAYGPLRIWFSPASSSSHRALPADRPTITMAPEDCGPFYVVLGDPAGGMRDER